ncbi:MAG: hypothetical protein BWK80_42265 [Desulfobacteraceae bacterium IS3]|nr:MAG: hypothetical protein BWK80_42265 [Desulfobacteraceae bacterium IS3]
MDFIGNWHITEMEMWDADYVNMEVQAYIKIKKNGSGEFQFGLVHGYLDGKSVSYTDGDKFEFSWEGNDEMDEASGSGWVRIKHDNKNELEGEFRFFQGDDSTFVAKRVSSSKVK